MDSNIVVLGLSLYAIASLGFLAVTYLEGEREGGSWDRWRVFGLTMCLIWPFHTVMIGLVALRYAKLGTRLVLLAN